jgi:predicted RNA polymerase sigma factor
LLPQPLQHKSWVRQPQQDAATKLLKQLARLQPQQPKMQGLLQQMRIEVSSINLAAVQAGGVQHTPHAFMI